VKIFALRALGIGDLLTAVPALRGLRAGRPGAELVLGVPDWLAPLACLAAVADEIVGVPELDEPPDVPVPDVAVNLHGRGPQSHRILMSLRPKTLWAFACAEAAFRDGPSWTTPTGEDEHEIHRWCRMLDWYGIGCDPDDLALPTPDMTRTRAAATILHPGAKDPRRRWPADRFIKVARSLENQGHRVVVTGSADDRDLARQIAEHAGLPPDRVLAGRTSLTELAALVAAARIVISGDTGIAHLASAYSTPSVVLFGRMPPARWGPPQRPWHHSLWRPTPEPINPDGIDTRVNAGLLRLSPSDVMHAVAKTLDKSPKVRA
jgi:ADP-heptose:LPS heptosyltransferase